MSWITLKDLGLEPEKETQLRERGKEEIISMSLLGKINLKRLPIVGMGEYDIFEFDYPGFDKSNTMMVVSMSIIAVKIYFFNLEEWVMELKE